MLAVKRQPAGKGAGLPRAVRYVLVSAALGASIGIGFGGLMIVTNVAGLRDLIVGSSDPITPVVLVLAGFATLFGGIYTAGSIMRMPTEDDEA